jgi:hypothetical protein
MHVGESDSLGYLLRSSRGGFIRNNCAEFAALQRPPGRATKVNLPGRLLAFELCMTSACSVMQDRIEESYCRSLLVGFCGVFESRLGADRVLCDRRKSHVLQRRRRRAGKTETSCLAVCGVGSRTTLRHYCRAPPPYHDYDKVLVGYYELSFFGRG